MKKEVENDVALLVIRHIGKYYDIILKDELVELKHEVEDLKET